MDYQQQKELLKGETERSFANIKNALSVFDEQSLNKQPFEGSWTAGQVGDHILKATHSIPDKRTVAANRPYDALVKPLENIFLNFETHLKSPDFILPANEPYQQQALLHELERTGQKHIHTIDTKDLTELCLDAEMPGFGQLTRYEWLSFIVMHVKRHTHQLNHIAQVMGLP